MNKNIFGLIGTLMVHTTIMLLLLKPTSSISTSAQLTVERNALVVVELLPSGDDQPYSTGYGKTISGTLCGPHEKTYVGIGIMYTTSTGQITDAPPFFPGYQSGLRIGDLVLGITKPDDYNIVRANILHFGAVRPDLYVIKATKICFREAIIQLLHESI